MAIDEQSRHELYLKLEELLGRDEATTLMEHLPPVGWADVATKRDLDHLAAMTKRDLDHVSATLRAEFRSEFLTFQRHIVSWMIGLNVTLTGMAIAATKLL